MDIRDAAVVLLKLFDIKASSRADALMSLKSLKLEELETCPLPASCVRVLPKGPLSGASETALGDR